MQMVSEESTLSAEESLSAGAMTSRACVDTRDCKTTLVVSLKQECVLIKQNKWIQGTQKPKLLCGFHIQNMKQAPASKQHRLICS